MQTKNHNNSLKRPLIVWAVLIMLTLATLGVSTTGRISFLEQAASAIIVLSFIKIWLVVWNFMEIRHAPRFLKLAFTLWCAGVALVLILIFTGVIPF